MQDQPESSLLLCRMSQQEGKKKKKTQPKRKDWPSEKYQSEEEDTVFCFLLLLLAVAGVTGPAANIREPWVSGRMFGCQLHGGKEQWLFNLLFIAKPIWEE